MAGYRALNVKQMLEVYLNCDDYDQAQNIWNSFVVMRDHGFISPYEWNRFYDIAHETWLSRP